MFKAAQTLNAFCFQGLIRELRILKDKVEHLEDEKLQYEKKLKATKVREKVTNFLLDFATLKFLCGKLPIYLS